MNKKIINFALMTAIIVCGLAMYAQTMLYVCGIDASVFEVLGMVFA